MFGVYPDADRATGNGNIWLVAKEGIEKFKHSAHRHFRSQIEVLASAGSYTTLVATTYAANTLHHAWLKALGFVLDGYATNSFGHQFYVFKQKVAV